MSRGPLLALSVVLALPGSARAACPEPSAAASALPDVARTRVNEARVLAGQGACEAAAGAATAAYDALGGQPRRHLDVLHALLADVVHLQLAAHHTQRARLTRPRPNDPGDPGDPGVATEVQGPLCAADVLVLRHQARVRAIGRASPGFEATLARVRGELHARLAGARCPAQDPDEVVIPAPASSTGFRSDLLLRPGQLAAETRERRSPPAPGGPRWRIASRGGFALMALGLMAIGGGIAAGAAEGPRQGALQGSLLVGGALMFVGGFPLLMVADHRARAALALGPGGARLHF